MTTRSKKLPIASALVGVALVATTVLSAMPAGAVAGPAPAGLTAFVNGTLLHAHAPQLPPKVADVDQAFAISAINSGGLTKQLVNEVNEAVAPQGAGKFAYARGGGAEVGLIEDIPTNSVERLLVLPSVVEAIAPTAVAPFTNGLQNSAIVDLEGALDPLANAAAVQGRAAALWNPKYLFPTLGNPLTYSYGGAADVQALNMGELNELGQFTNPLLSTDTDGPNRAVSSAQTFSYLVNNGDGTCGLAAEIHQTIAPVSLRLPGTNLLLEVGGDWLMKGVATGKATGNFFTYGPDPTTNAPNTPLIRLVDTTVPGEPVVLESLTTQDILGGDGLVLPANPLIDLAVGENARAIAPPQADGTPTDPNADSTATHTGTAVSAAADVLRLRLLQGVASPFQLADVRLGHFEMDMKVPAGGVACEIPIAKTSSVPVAAGGEDITFTVKIPSDPKAVIPFPCDLTNVTVSDILAVEKADDPSKPPKMNIVSGVGPNGQKGTVSANKQSITFGNIGTWKPGAPSLVVTILAEVAPDSGSGIMRDTATATASAANCKASNSVIGDVIGLINGSFIGNLDGSTDFFGANGSGLTGNIRGGGKTGLTGKGVLKAPKVGPLKVAPSELPATGVGDSTRLFGLGALVLALVLLRWRKVGSAKI